MAGSDPLSARWMDPNTGTFLSVDPVVPAYDDPQSLNAYAYARNNPVTLTDPNGMCVILFSCGMITPAGFSVGGDFVETTSTRFEIKDGAGNVVYQTDVWTSTTINGRLDASLSGPFRITAGDLVDWMSQSQSRASGAGRPDPLTDAELEQAKEWVQQTREGLVEIGKGVHRAPWPSNYVIDSIDVSRTQPEGEPTTAADARIGSRESIGGRLVRTVDITIYPVGARSFREVFISVGHEIGHLFKPGAFTHSQLDLYGAGLWGVYQDGGIYSGPRPNR